MAGGYQDLGSRGPQLGVSDLGQQINPFLLGTGWDVIFDPQAINTGLTLVEIYHIAIDGPVGSSIIVLRNRKVWDYVSQGWKNGWDPSQPMPLAQTDTLEICWNVAATNPPYNTTTNIQPSATVWLRLPVGGP